MANWKKLLKQVLLSDGKIDTDETELLKEEILADDVIDDDEIKFLNDLRNNIRLKRVKFEEFFFLALKKYVLADGKVDAKEVDKINEILLADGKVDKRERKFLKELKAEASNLSPKFSKAFDKYLK